MKGSLEKSVAYIETFRGDHRQPPGRDEFLLWSKANQLVGVCDYEVSTNSDDASYQIYIWRGERMLVYSSQDKSLRDAGGHKP
jgi:hypothetical protein